MNKKQLKDLIQNLFKTNGVRLISAENVRTYNDAALEATYLSAGSIIVWPGIYDTIPTNWVLCDGRQVNQVDYPDLFAALGGQLSPWGVQPTTFNLPKISACSVPIQSEIGRDKPQLAEVGGETTHILTIEEMPKHSHLSTQISSSQIVDYNLSLQSGRDYETSQQATRETGKGLAHNNMPPYVGMFWIIKIL